MTHFQSIQNNLLTTLRFLYTDCSTCPRSSGQELEQGGNEGPRTRFTVHYAGKQEPFGLSNILVPSICKPTSVTHLLYAGLFEKPASTLLTAFPTAMARNSRNLHTLYLQLKSTIAIPQ